MKIRLKTALGLVALALVAAPLGSVSATGTARADRTIYVTILGPQGPVSGGVQPSDLKVMEDGTEREITKVDPATEPVSAIVLLDTTRDASNYILHFREGVTGFANALFADSPQSRLALAQFGGQAMITQPFTSSVDDITAALGHVVANTDGGSLLNDELIEASNELAKEETPRRLIITLNIEETQEFSQARFEQVADAVRNSGATVYSIQVLTDGTKRDPGREGLLNALTANSGGMLRTTQTPQEQLAGFLNSIAVLATTQFAVTFTRPDGEAPPQKTEVSVVTHEGFRVLTNVWSGK